MPTETFFRLPEEKRMRFLDAAWAEFTRVSVAEVSVNRIVQTAGIPRGSFYQYFADKEDLFAYFMDGLRAHFSARLMEYLERTGGDLFDAQLMAYDHFAARREHSNDPMLDRGIRMLKLNPSVDIQKIATSYDQSCIIDELLEKVDAKLLCRQDTDYVRRVYSLSLMVLGSMVMEQLLHPERVEQCRTELANMLEIIKRGSLRGQSEAV